MSSSRQPDDDEPLDPSREGSDYSSPHSESESFQSQVEYPPQISLSEPIKFDYRAWEKLRPASPSQQSRDALRIFEETLSDWITDEIGPQLEIKSYITSNGDIDWMERYIHTKHCQCRQCRQCREPPLSSLDAASARLPANSDDLFRRKEDLIRRMRDNIQRDALLDLISTQPRQTTSFSNTPQQDSTTRRPQELLPTVGRYTVTPSRQPRQTASSSNTPQQGSDVARLQGNRPPGSLYLPGQPRLPTVFEPQHSSSPSTNPNPRSPSFTPSASRPRPAQVATQQHTRPSTPYPNPRGPSFTPRASQPRPAQAATQQHTRPSTPYPIQNARSPSFIPRVIRPGQAQTPAQQHTRPSQPTRTRIYAPTQGSSQTPLVFQPLTNGRDAPEFPPGLAIPPHIDSTPLPSRQARTPTVSSTLLPSATQSRPRTHTSGEEGRQSRPNRHLLVIRTAQQPVTAPSRYPPCAYCGNAHYPGLNCPILESGRRPH
ncbi:hypothetical protein EJ04DRAFT_551969 [Polyplosphaeria fusca]|uniref:Uncharacterized protein n=1 Tax=Polyplosphaeria fusca TaxID=682080 RepID=A0A9P4V2D5_9PLEO|nr:hypothetical protein EJ04DRAFT_551969 [Polyplosphaeria fusca]